MNLLKNNTHKNEDEFKELLAAKYDLGTGEYHLGTDEGVICAMVLDRTPRNAKIEITVTPDGQKAFMSLYPPLYEGSTITMENINTLITAHRISVNLKTEAIRQAFEIFSDRGIIENVLIAEGVASINGSDARVRLNFNPINSEPKLLSDGRVDYKNIDNMRLASKGDLLISKKLLTSGVRGLTVRGEEIQPLKGKDVKIIAGEGVIADEEEKEFYADLDGCVTFHQNRLSVNPIYTVTGNVDYSTGNIFFNGVVHVKGDVLGGFIVKADKDIMIDGIVQDAVITSGGSIIIKTGLKGEQGCHITAEGDVTVTYTENAVVKAKGNIDIMKYSFNSDLSAGGHIQAISKPGIITGGTVTAFSEINAMQAGTRGNSNFTMKVGTKYFFEEEMRLLRENKTKYAENMEKVDEFLSKLDTSKKEILNNPKVRQLLILRKQITDSIAKNEEQIKKLLKAAYYKNPRIKIDGTVFEGLEVQIFKCRHIVKEAARKVIFSYDEKFERVIQVSLDDKAHFN